MSEVKPVIRIKTAMERFQDYMKAKGLPKKSSLVHINKISEFEQCERNELREAYEATQAENAKLKDSNAELERLCDVTYVKQGADAYNHCCEVFETWRIKRQKQGLSTHDWADGLYNSLSWLQGTVEELEQKHTAQAKRIAELEEKEKVLDRLIAEFEGKHRFMGTMRVHKKFPHDLHTGLNTATVCAEHIDVFQWVFRSNGECSFKKAVMNLLSQKNRE